MHVPQLCAIVIIAITVHSSLGIKKNLITSKKVTHTADRVVKLRISQWDGYM
jgi:hypothetical protein